jgi:hypothetical protein
MSIFTNRAERHAIILSSPNQWSAWLQIVRLEAGTAWKYIDPNVEVHDELRKPSDVELSKEEWDGMNADQKEYMKISIRKQEREQKVYEREVELLNRTDKLILSSISEVAFRLVELDTDPATRLRKLKTKYAPTDATRTREAELKYQRAKTLKRSDNITAWLERFQIAVSTGQALDIPDTANNRPQKDFMAAIHSRYSAFYSSEMRDVLFKSPQDDDYPSLQTLLERFDIYLKESMQAPDPEMSVVLASTFRGETAAQTSDRDPLSRCICGMQHNPYACFYFNTKIAPKSWRPQPEKQKKIREAMKDPNFRKEVEQSIAAHPDYKPKLSKWRRSKSAEEDSDKGQTTPTSMPTLPNTNFGVPHTPNGGATQAISNAVTVSLSIARRAKLQTIQNLKNKWMLDPGSDLHICNSRVSFTEERLANPNDIVITGSDEIPIHSYGTVKLVVFGEKYELRTITLFDVAYVPGFLTNLVSLHPADEHGIHFDSGRRKMYDGTTGETVCRTIKIGGHWFVSENSKESAKIASEYTLHDVALASSRATRRPLTASRLRWHHIMGHPSPETMDHLAQNAIGVSFEENSRSPAMQECQTCIEAKLHQQISRRTDSEFAATAPFERIAIDLIQIAPLKNPSYNGEQYFLHAFCYFSKLHVGMGLLSKSQEDISKAMRQIFNYISNICGSNVRQATLGFIRPAGEDDNEEYALQPSSIDAPEKVQYTIKYLRMDDERGFGKSLRDMAARRGIKIELRSPNTPAQNGAAERAGGIIIERARALKIRSNLPGHLSIEIIKYAMEILNRTPTEALGWKSPYEVVFGNKPDLSHFHSYGCKAFVLNKKIPRAEKLQSRAFIGYLVGIDSRNIYRIWLPRQNKIVRTRDVVFQEDEFYKADTREEVDDEVIHVIEIPDSQPRLEDSDDESDDEEATPSDEEEIFNNIAIQPIVKPTSSMHPEKQPEKQSDHPENRYLTPESPPQQASTAATKGKKLPKGWIPADEYIPDRHQNNAPKAFKEGTHNIIEGKRTRKGKSSAPMFASAVHSSGLRLGFSFAAKIERDLTVESSPDEIPARLHRDDLPPEPKSWKAMLQSRFAKFWINAAKQEMHNLLDIHTFEPSSWEEVKLAGMETDISYLKWVFKYKFDSDGYLVKFKARLCVRGDLQEQWGDTYAATLAIKVFRAMMAIAAYYDLEIRFCDAINAFLNAHLRKKVFCRPPQGFEHLGEILLLLRALYGMQEAPRLWYEELTKTLRNLGLHPVKDAPCLFTNDHMIVFFYVDDIVTMCRTRDLPKLEEFENKLAEKYKIRRLGDLKSFLGVRVERDRKNRKLWLCQDSYINSVVKKFDLAPKNDKYPSTPRSMHELLPYTGEPDAMRTRTYQKLTGHLGYLACITRPDVCNAHSTFAAFNNNPGPEHLSALIRCWRYLDITEFMALEAGGDIQATSEAYVEGQEQEQEQKQPPLSQDLIAASDAAFADDSTTRRSTQGYIFRLFGMPVDWKSTLQKTVTKSTTQAELLALSAAASELTWWSRVFNEIGFEVDPQPSILCDNLQTVRLVNKDTERLQTKLKHVDIHQMWLREQVQDGNILVEWIKTADQPADGLTKPLPPERHLNFMKQLGLVNIEELVKPGS